MLPVMALRGMTVFPEQTVHFDIGRPHSMKALEAAMKADQYLFLIPQKDLAIDDPTLKDLYPLGTVAKVKQVLRSPGETLRVLVSGICRGRIVQTEQEKPFYSCLIEAIEEPVAPDSARNHALCRKANVLYGIYCELAEQQVQAVQLRMLACDHAGFIADCIAQNSGMDYQDKAKLLCQTDPVRRLEQTISLLDREIEMLQLESDIQEKTHEAIDRNQKEYYLREQLRVIREELGESDEQEEFDEYRIRIRKLALEAETQKKLLKEVDRLQKQPFGSAEASVLRNYLDAVLELPWNTKTKERLDITLVKKALDKDHFGMEKVKERILETIAVRQIAPQMPAQILCLVGPPGVGKTSVAYSIARSLNRKMARISLGGVHDEADIRGHRKTYVGAMPGRIMAAMTQAGSRNPLLLLDEIDKMGADHRGDPAAALLEVLDTEQNMSYRDHYLEVPFDLSDVMFITTANTLDTIPRPLLDRMEIIELGSYTDEEKLAIAVDHLIPKQLRKHGLKKSQLKITEDAVRESIRGYTRESGVRELERCIAQICRKADKAFAEQGYIKKLTVTPDDLAQYLGTRKYIPEHRAARDEIGLVTGLAWTSVGGETLAVEVNVMDGSGKLELTGNLGDVMKESAHAAYSYIRANAQKLGVAPDFYKTRDIHVHFPEGAVPKDGPSAGITVCTAMVSALTDTPVRRDVAMTGEISLRGRVLPIGGLKEKTMAALRHGVRTVIIPYDNLRDLDDIDRTVRAALDFVPAQYMDAVLETALLPKPQTQNALLPELPMERRTRAGTAGIRQ